MVEVWGCLWKFVWWLCKFQKPFWICEYMSLAWLPFSFGHFIEPPVVSFRTFDQLPLPESSSMPCAWGTRQKSGHMANWRFPVVYSVVGTDYIWLSCLRLLTHMGICSGFHISKFISPLIWRFMSIATVRQDYNFAPERTQGTLITKV